GGGRVDDAFGDGRRMPVGTDAHHVAVAAAVQEVAVDGVGEVAVAREVAERVDELLPVRDQGRLVQRPFQRQADEGGDRGADPFDRRGAGWLFFDEDAR